MEDRWMSRVDLCKLLGKSEQYVNYRIQKLGIGVKRIPNTNPRTKVKTAVGVNYDEFIRKTADGKIKTMKKYNTGSKNKFSPDNTELATYGEVNRMWEQLRDSKNYKYEDIRDLFLMIKKHGNIEHALEQKVQSGLVDQIVKFGFYKNPNLLPPMKTEIEVVEKHCSLGRIVSDGYL